MFDYGCSKSDGTMIFSSGTMFENSFQSHLPRFKFLHGQNLNVDLYTEASPIQLMPCLHTAAFGDPASSATSAGVQPSVFHPSIIPCPSIVLSGQSGKKYTAGRNFVDSTRPHLLPPQYVVYSSPSIRSRCNRNLRLLLLHLLVLRSFRQIILHRNR